MAEHSKSPSGRWLRAELRRWEQFSFSILVETSMNPAAESVSVYGTAVAPATGTAIASIADTQLPAGLYRVITRITYGAVGGLLDGFELRKGSAQFARLMIAAVAMDDYNPGTEFFVELDGSTGLSVNALGNGPAGSVYNARLIATRIKR